MLLDYCCCANSSARPSKQSGCCLFGQRKTMDHAIIRSLTQVTLVSASLARSVFLGCGASETMIYCRYLRSVPVRSPNCLRLAHGKHAARRDTHGHDARERGSRLDTTKSNKQPAMVPLFFSSWATTSSSFDKEPRRAKGEPEATEERAT